MTRGHVAIVVYQGTHHRWRDEREFDRAVSAHNNKESAMSEFELGRALGLMEARLQAVEKRLNPMGGCGCGSQTLLGNFATDVPAEGAGAGPSSLPDISPRAPCTFMGVTYGLNARICDANKVEWICLVSGWVRSGR